ncbi:MAG: 3-deoxy-7-phosphoheptulonate synthase [Bacillota bacterium]|jgi:3-deoxy-7-phosphoheptulonate synthase|nr:3-deoxy-7-phosphoheptulonate synthase [Bacillota bacterium]MDK2882808.1 3-deoxy-7-phosphoheptulonate synthase [Bacillota bacterium]
MVIVMQAGATQEDVERVISRLKEAGFGVHLSEGTERTIIGALGGDRQALARQALEALPGVERVVPVLHPYKLVSREFKPEPTVVKVGDVAIGGNEVVVIAGPCAVESEEQILATARAVKAAGARILRGGAFKPRSSPYSFQGLGEDGLRLLALARAETGLPIVTEVLDVRTLETVAAQADMIQIGARNMQNFELLREVGVLKLPVLLKRGLSATIEEWLLAAEYIMREGNDQIVLCERGIRNFDTATRNTLDLAAVPLLHRLSHLPVIVDPSHATGKWHLVAPMSLAAVAAGADGLIIEVHPDPATALSDGPQSLTPERFAELMIKLGPVAQAVERTLAMPPKAYEGER